MPHPCVVAAASTIHQLRQAAITTTAEDGVQLGPDVYFSWDSAQAGVDIAVQSAPGHLMTAQITLQGDPRWFALNIGLGGGAFDAGDGFGLVINAASSAGFDCQPFVRSTKAGEVFDTTLAQPVRLTPEGGPAVALHSVEASDPLVWAGEFHTLVLPLPKQGFQLDLRDLRLVHLGAADAPGGQQRTLTSVAY